MNYHVIINQGRVADRTDGALVGARNAGQALAEHLSTKPTIIGQPSPAAQDDWRQALDNANETLRELAEITRSVLDDHQIPLLVTNTCAASIATLPVAAAKHPEAAFLWIDAHGDFNTPDTTASGYLGGMALAGACGLWDTGHGGTVDPRNVILIGARDIDNDERAMLQNAGVSILAPEHATPEAVQELVADRPVWIHVDWDVLEPGYIPAAYKIPSGLLPRHVAAIFAALPTESIRGVELAEFEAGDPNIPERLSIEFIVETFQHLT
ncbi:arginase family protein [Paeniglutamicibacter antarcticus]|uniref:Arginase n=1 Tax=Paeniglutamicibacter antarcticus TaxID=494023 RepID=A0ABP9TKF4_9MICC